MLGRHGAARPARRRPGGIRTIAAAAATGCSALVLMLVLSGCDALLSDQEANPTAAPNSSSTPDASAGGPAPPPVFVPGGTAEENRPFFDSVSQRVLAGDPEAGGRAFVDALVAAGFEKGAMEVTEDQTAIGNDVDAVQFSVRIGESCLIGERSSTGFVSVVAPVLGTGSCLIGETRTIDW